MSVNGQDPSLATATVREEFRRHWPLVAAGFFGLMIGVWALPLQLIGPLTTPLKAEFGWSTGEVGAAMSALSVGTLIGTLVVGFLADRGAARALALGSMAGLGLSVAGLSLIQGASWQLHLCYFLMGLLGSGTGGLVFTRVVGSWFHKGRGLALGIVLAGSGVAAFVTPLLAQWLISMLGWREASLVFAAIVFFVAMPIIAVGMRRPAPVKRDDGQASDAIMLYGMTRGQAVRDFRFYVLLLSISIFGIFLVGVVINIVPMLIDRGMAPMDAAKIASSLGIAMVIGRIGIGSLLDRFPAALIGAAIFFLGALGAALFVLGGVNAALFMTTATGLLLGAEVDLLSFMTFAYFGNRHYGAIYGLLITGYACGSLISPLVAAGLITMGGYDLLFVSTAIGFASAGLLMLGLGVRREKAPLRPAEVG